MAEKKTLYQSTRLTTFLSKLLDKTTNSVELILRTLRNPFLLKNLGFFILNVLWYFAFSFTQGGRKFVKPFFTHFFKFHHFQDVPFVLLQKYRYYIDSNLFMFELNQQYSIFSQLFEFQGWVFFHTKRKLNFLTRNFLYFSKVELACNSLIKFCL